jgi:hypothetical protein
MPLYDNIREAAFKAFVGHPSPETLYAAIQKINETYKLEEAETKAVKCRAFVAGMLAGIGIQPARAVA